ncbi:MAG: hypothetical protein J1E63_09630 [Muribaculaceae bacterium]|nr:hypothetical protein [Muribaculaceae bacterium]
MTLEIGNPLIEVIGIGQETAPAISEICKLGNEDLAARMFNGQLPSPDTYLAILLISDDTDATALADAYKQAGALTLIVSTGATKTREDSYDSMTIVSADRMAETVKALILPILNRGLATFDMNDLRQLLHNSKRFKTLSTMDNGVTDRVKAALNKIEPEFKAIKNIKNIGFMVVISPVAENQLTMAEIVYLQEFCEQIDNDVNIIWTVYTNPQLAGDMEVDILVSGPEIEFQQLLY